MTDNEYAQIVDVWKDGDRIVYRAEHPEKGTLKGTLSKNIGPFTVLSDNAMDDLASSLIGKKVEWSDAIQEP